MKHAWFLLLAVMMFASCGGQSESSPGNGGVGGVGGTSGSNDGGPPDALADAVPDVTPPPGQDILFEVTYENYAWQPSLNGVFITSDGSIYSYDFFAQDAGAQPPAVVYPATEQEIRARYGANPVKTGSIPVSELLAHFAFLPAAAGGVLLRNHMCADAGENTAMGYLFDEASARYSPVILGAIGDSPALNIAPAAAALVDWLSPHYKLDASCVFVPAVCTGATCGQPAPSCPAGQTPSVVGGCWSSCVSISQCLSVSDCSQCGGGMVCATSTDGSAHCLGTTCASTDACSCPFMPACAGGSAFCSNSGPMHASCGP